MRTELSPFAPHYAVTWPLDFWAPSLQAARVLAQANFEMTLRFMHTASALNPYLRPLQYTPPRHA